MKELRVFFDSFWGTFDRYDNIFIWILSQNYKVVVTNESPHIIFTDSPTFKKPNNFSVCVYFSGEPFFNIGECDFALTSFYVNDERFIRFPLYTLYAYDLYKHNFTNSYAEILNKKYSIETINEKQNVCAYISQGAGGDCPREVLIKEAMNRLDVHCAGNHLNNFNVIPGEPGTIFGSINKINFLKKYKFCFAIENNDRFNGFIGYTTEKIFEPMVANCIPIYWGNDLIKNDFNKDSFLNVKDFKDYDELINKIIEIDSNKELYIDYLMQPFISTNQYFEKDYLVSLFDKFV